MEVLEVVGLENNKIKVILDNIVNFYEFWEFYFGWNLIEYVFENFCWCLNLEVFSLLNNNIFVFLVEVENFWCIYILILLNNKFEF